jgi:hypothetical protein
MNDARARPIERWPRAPGYDELLDRANELVVADIGRPGHRHHVVARDKNGAISFDSSAQPPYDYLCDELRSALEAIEVESGCTCEHCGQAGIERPEHLYHVLCVEHAAAHT